MKIIFIGDSYIPQSCGMTSVIKYLAEGLASKGHNITVIANDSKQIYERESCIANVKVIRFSIKRDKFYHTYGDTDNLVRFVKESGADAIVFESLGSVPCDVFLKYDLKDFPGVKLLHSHGDPYATLKPFVFKNGIHFFFANLKSYLLLGRMFSNSYPKYISQQDIVLLLSKCCSDYPVISKNASRYDVLGNAVDDMFFDENCTPFSLNIKHSKYIISIASYYELKNQKEIVENYLKSDMQDVSLVLIGTARTVYYDDVKSMADAGVQKNKNKDILMLTNIDRKYFPYILRNASLYVVASRKEEFSISLAEAMTSGLPFISTNVGNAKELPGGIVIKHLNNLAKAMQLMFVDDNKRKTYGLAAKEYASSHFKQSEAVNKLESIIRFLINEKQKKCKY